MAGGSFPDFVDHVSLVDHHVHGAFHADGDEARFQNSLNEGNTEPLAHPGGHLQHANRARHPPLVQRHS